MKNIKRLKRQRASISPDQATKIITDLFSFYEVKKDNYLKGMKLAESDALRGAHVGCIEDLDGDQLTALKDKNLSLFRDFNENLRDVFAVKFSESFDGVLNNLVFELCFDDPDASFAQSDYFKKCFMSALMASKNKKPAFDQSNLTFAFGAMSQWHEQGLFLSDFSAIEAKKLERANLQRQRKKEEEQSSCNFLSFVADEADEKMDSKAREGVRVRSGFNQGAVISNINAAILNCERDFLRSVLKRRDAIEVIKSSMLAKHNIDDVCELPDDVYRDYSSKAYRGLRAIKNSTTLMFGENLESHGVVLGTSSLEHFTKAFDQLDDQLVTGRVFKNYLMRYVINHADGISNSLIPSFPIPNVFRDKFKAEKFLDYIKGFSGGADLDCLDQPDVRGKVQISSQKLGVV